MRNNTIDNNITKQTENDPSSVARNSLNEQKPLCDIQNTSDQSSLDKSNESSCYTNVKKIPLNISVSLGCFNIDVSNKNPLPIGKIIKIYSDTPNLVNLMYQGQEIGRGELLSIDGQLAVRIKKHWNR